MSKNKFFTSPLGIGLGVAVGAISIGLIGFGAYKFTGNNSVRSSSLFTMLDQRDSSMSEQNEEYQPEKQNYAFSKKTNLGHTKIMGGKKRSKKRRIKKSKKRNTLKK
jgi:hypothetical protein